MISNLIMIPGIIMLVGALLLPVLPRRSRSAAFILFPLIALSVLWMLPAGDHLQIRFAAYELHPLRVDALSRIFGAIFALTAIIGGAFAYHMKELGQQCAALAYAAGAVGVCFSGDLFSLYIFWEIMAFSSVYLVWARRTDASLKAGMRYILVHFFGGGLLLTGILLHLSNGGTLSINALHEFYSLPKLFMLAGLFVNAAIPPLHAWLPDAYAKATITGAVFMCVYTTKTAVYALIRLFPGWEILIWFGIIMAIYGTIYALIVNDIREILAYSVISQVGYMVTAVGIGTELALNGAAAHAVSHILYKSLLFMGAGGVIYATGKSKLTQLGGLAPALPWIAGLYMVGAFSISGFPFFNGFISKSMIISATGNAHYEWGMLLLLVASIGSYLHTGLRLPYFTWFDSRKQDLSISKIPFNQYAGMGLAALLCIFFGLFPSTLYQYLPYPADYHPYTWYHAVETVQILTFGFIGFWLLRDKLRGKPVTVLDTDWFYRRSRGLAWNAFVELPDRVFSYTEQLAYGIASGLTEFSRNPLKYIQTIAGSRHSDKVESDDFTAPIHAVLGLVLVTMIIAILFLTL